MRLNTQADQLGDIYFVDGREKYLLHHRGHQRQASEAGTY
jgi:hypothetical protein